MTTTLDREPRETPSAPAPAPGSAIRTFRPDIEGLRAIAVILVVLAHAELTLPGGYVGVDVFFVISGFLITRQLVSEFQRTRRISVAQFYARRVRRILPAATVVIVVSMLAIWRWASPLRVPEFARDGVFSAVSGINWRLAVQGTDYFNASASPNPFQHYWSLAVEEQFYILWPALLILVGAVGARRFGRTRSLVLVLLAIMAVSLYLSAATTSTSTSLAYFGLHTRAWELAIGALLALSVGLWTRMPPALASQMSWLGLGMIVLAGASFSSSTPYPGTAVILPVIGSAFVIAGGCPGWGRSGEFVLKRWPMQLIGRLSYSWYLWHWPVLVIAPMALGHPLGTAEALGCVVGSLILAGASYYLVERPFRLNRVMVRIPRLGLAVGAVLVTSSVAVALLISSAVTIPGGSGTAVAAAKPVSVTAVEKAVSEAAALETLPANVTPSLTDAPKDHPNTHGCMASYVKAEPLPDSACTFGDPEGAKTIVMVGDSHANGWVRAVEAFATTYHWKFILYAKAACPPGVYKGYIDGDLDRVYTECDTWRDAVFARVQTIKPDVVLIASQLRTLAINPDGQVSTVKTFQATGAKVVYLQDTPFAASTIGSIPECLAKNYDDVQKCSIPRLDPLSRLEGMAQRRVEAQAMAAAGAIVMDPTDWFCTKTVCPPVINNIVVYSDDNHTTGTYVSWLAPQFAKTLATLIR